VPTGDELIAYALIFGAAVLLVTTFAQGASIAPLVQNVKKAKDWWSSRKPSASTTDPRLAAIEEALDLRDNAVGEDADKQRAQQAADVLILHYAQKYPKKDATK